MSNVLIFIPKHKLDCQKNYDEFVNFTKYELTLFEDYEFDGKTGWESDKWGWEVRDRILRVTFGVTEGSYKYTPFKAPFSDFARAYARYQMSLKSFQSFGWFAAIKFLYLALEEKTLIKSCTNSVDLMDIDNAVINRANELIINNKGTSEIVKRGVCLSLEGIVKFIIKMKFKLNLQQYKNPIKREKDSTTHLDKESQAKQNDKCPSDFQILQVAKAFRIAKTPKQKYFSSVAVILMSHPSRCAEIFGLTVNSLQTTENSNMYLMWHPAKGGEPIRKPILKHLQAVTIQAVERLDKISRPARKAVKFAYKNPNDFIIHDNCTTPKSFSQDKELTYDQFASALGLTPTSGRGHGWGSAPQKWINRIISEINEVKDWKKLLKKNHCIAGDNRIMELGCKHEIAGVNIKFPTYRDIRKYIDKTYKRAGFPKLINSDIYLWDCITLIRKNEFHAQFKLKDFSWVFQSNGSINNAFGSQKYRESIFHELGITDEDGSPLSLTTHQFRHWLNTKLQMAGVDEWIIARFSGRADVNQNKEYDGRTMAQKQRLTKLIGHVGGDNSANELTMMDVNTKLSTYTADNPPSPLVLHELGLKVSLKSLGTQRVGVAQFTGLGFCTHNYAQSPCMKNSDCTSCKEHVCMKGLPNTLEEIKGIEALISEQYEQALISQGEQVFGADRWVSSLGFRLAKIRTILKFMKNPSATDGEMIRIPDELDPSPIKRALTKDDKLQEISTTIDLIELTKNNLEVD